MNFKQKKDGSCTLNFSEEEIKIIQRTKKIYFTDESLRHFGNALVRIVAEFNQNFNEETKNIETSTEENAINGLEEDDS